MIYLIGGPPKCGKTTLAKELMKTQGIPWISSDTLESVISRYVTGNRAKAFPHGYLKGETNDEMYANFSPMEIMQGYIDQSRTSRAAVETFVECEMIDGNDYVIEGYHVTPSIAAALEKKYRNKVRSAFLVRTDRQRLIGDFHKSTTRNDWILRKTKRPETFAKIAEMIGLYGEWFTQEAKKYALTVYDMDEDFEKRLQQIAEDLQNSPAR